MYAHESITCAFRWRGSIALIILSRLFDDLSVRIELCRSFASWRTRRRFSSFLFSLSVLSAHLFALRILRECLDIVVGREVSLLVHESVALTQEMIPSLRDFQMASGSARSAIES